MEKHKKLVRSVGLAVAILILMALLAVGLEGNVAKLTEVVLEGMICGSVEGFIEI